jgi:hypothetical protein
MRNGPLTRADHLANNQVVWPEVDTPRGDLDEEYTCVEVLGEIEGVDGADSSVALKVFFLVRPPLCNEPPLAAGARLILVPYTTPMFRTWTATINVAAALVGGVRTLIGARLSERVRDTAMRSIGLVTLLVGLQSFLRFHRTSTQLVPTRKRERR